MSNSDKYLLDKDGNVYRYANGQPVRLEDFDQEPSDRSYAEANKLSYKERVQMMLDIGVPVSDDILRKAGMTDNEAE
jgi:hypothetical protein